MNKMQKLNIEKSLFYIEFLSPQKSAGNLEKIDPAIKS